MVLLRRDNGVAATAAGPSSASIGMLCLGIAALVIASGLCGVFYVQIRKTRAVRAEMMLQEKRSKIGKPVLQHAPEDVIEASLDLSRMTNEMRQHFAQRPLQPQQVRPSVPAQKSSTVTWSLPQSSSGSSGTNSSGPIPTSSSDGTNASSGVRSSEGTASTYHSASATQSSTPQRPRRSATQPSSPSMIREKRGPRIAVPSALLRGLGDLPQLPAPGASSGSISDGQEETTLDTKPRQQISLTDANTPGSSPKAMYKDFEAQGMLSHPSIERSAIAGPSPITVDYFSMTSRRNMTPPRSSSTHNAKATSGKHSANSSHSSSSPYKKPDMELPPLPTVTQKQTSAHDSIFRPLSLGLFLKSSSKSSSLNAATMFGDLSDTFWNDGADKSARSTSTPPKREVQEQSVSTSSSKDSTIHTALLTASRRGSDTSDTATSVNDAYDGASFTNEELQRSQSSKSVKEVKEISEVKKVQVVREEPQDANTVPLNHDGTSFAPFMTPHHRAVFPDQLRSEEEDKRSSGAMTPDLSQIHSAPLPPSTFPLPSQVPVKSGFASSFRAKAKMTLTRAKTISTPSQPPALVVKAAPVAAKKSLDVARPRVDSLASVARSPANTVASYHTVVETQRPSIEQPMPSLGLGLGLGLTDGNGKAVETSTPFVQERKVQFHSPAFQKHIGNRASSKMSQYSDATFSPSMKHAFRSPMHDDYLGTPPLRQIESAQYAVLSTLSPKLGQTPTMIGNDWMLNRKQGNHAHKSSYASSACDTISSCVTGDTMSMYDGGRAQDQRAKLLQTIQHGKKVPFGQSPTVDQTSFFSHSARVSVNTSSPRPFTPSLNGNTRSQEQGTPTGPLTSRQPANLNVEIKRGALLASEMPHSAPLTPPLTPGERTSLLAKAAPVLDKTPSREEETAARMAKLRPLSLAVVASNGGTSTPSPWHHRSQYSTASTATAPSASSSVASLYTSPHRISSTLATSPSRANFKKSSAAPLGVLPTLGADASPSFLMSTPRLQAAAASPRSSRQTTVTWGDLTANTPSPRFATSNRTSINVNAMPYHSPLSIDAFTSPLRIRK